MAFETSPDLNKVFVRPMHLVELRAMYEGNSTVTDVLDDIIADLDALITSGHADDGTVTDFAARTETDGKCLGKGWYSKKEDTQNEDDLNVKRLCNGCGAWGKRSDTNEVIKQWTKTEEPKTDVG